MHSFFAFILYLSPSFDKLKVSSVGDEHVGTYTP